MEKFIDTGRFICRASFLYKNPKIKLLADCTDVVQYGNGKFIQVLKTGIFYVDKKFSSKSLDEAEINLWRKIENK